MSSSDFGKYITRTILCVLMSVSLTFGGVPTRVWAEMFDADPVISDVIQEEAGSIDNGVEEPGLDNCEISDDEFDDNSKGDWKEGPVDVDQSIDDGDVPELNNAGNQQNDVVETSFPTEPILTNQDYDFEVRDAEVIESGTHGECSWSINSDGLFRIWPNNGVKGRLRGQSYYSTQGGFYLAFPWRDCAKKIVSVTFEPGVELPEDCCGMFSGCYKLESIDVSGWDTSYVTDMSGMFSGCSSLEVLDVSSWDTSSVTDMENMFAGCSWLEELDVSHWDTSSVQDMGGMFRNCSSLRRLDLSQWDTSRVAYLNNMFEGCSSLAVLNLSNWNLSSISKSKETFEETPYGSGYFSHTPGFEGLFSGCSSLKELNISDWNTTKVVNMDYMLKGCSSLVSLDVSSWDTSSVTSMNRMFQGCSSLASLDVSDWDTSSVRYIYSMFDGCSSLVSLDVSDWDTSSVGDSSGMFRECKSLASLDISRWDTSSVYDMSEMFSGCSSLSTLDVSNWDTHNTSRISSLFRDCSSLAALDLSSWDLSRVEPYSYSSVFYRCNSLACITVGRRFDTSRIFPEATAINGKWWSTKDGKWYTVDQIKESRKLVADTYINTDPSTDVSIAIVSKVSDQAFTGTGISPKFTVKVGGKTLREGTDYDVTYVSNVNVGTATATVRGKGAYGGAKSVTFKILPADISKCAMDPIPEQAYTGMAIRPAIALRLGSVLLRSGIDYTLSYKDNTEIGTATVTVTSKRNLTGSRQVTFRIVEEPTNQGMYRLYNPNSGEHFYTARAAERDALVALGWQYEGVGWLAPTKSGTPVYRLYNANAGDHHYTMKAAERDALKKAGWKYEGVGWYSDDAKGVPLYRQYNPNAVSGSHNYTTNKKENDALVKMGWKAEGIGWYGVKP